MLRARRNGACDQADDETEDDRPIGFFAGFP